MLNGAGVVFRKEVQDNLRDRRALSSSLFFPLLGPLLVVLLLVVTAKSMTSQGEKPLELPVVGAERAPSLIAFLGQNNVEIQPAPEDPEAVIKAGDLDVVLEIPEGFGEDFSAGRPATVQLILDDSRQSASVSVRRARRLLNSYSSRIGALRLLARGVDPTITEALAVEERDVATAQAQAARLLAMAPYFIIFAIFMGGLYLAIDTTAGERERGSLEPLLLNPVSRSQVVLGKYAATLLFTLVALIETLVAFALVFRFVPLERYLGIRIDLGTGALVGVFLVTVPMALLAAALQINIASFTRSFKEAQTYLSLLPLVPALPGLFLAFLPVKEKLWMFFIPTFGEQLLINQLMRGEALAPSFVTVSAVTTTLVALALLFLATRLYRSEKVVFGR